MNAELKKQLSQIRADLLEMKTMMQDIHAMFKPSQKKRLTKREIQHQATEKFMADWTAKILRKDNG